MGDSYREEIKKKQKKSGYAVATESSKEIVRKKALRREYFRKSHNRYRPSPQTQARLM